MNNNILDRDGRPIPIAPPDSPFIIDPPQPPRPTIIDVTDDDQRPAPPETSATFISDPRNVENPPTFSTVVGAPPTDSPSPASPPPIEIPETPVQPGQQLQLPRNDHFEALFTDEAYLQASAEELGLVELSRDLGDDDLIIRAANNALVDHVWPVEPASSAATLDLRRDTLYQQLTGSPPADHREFFKGLKRRTLERQALREQRFPTSLEQQYVRAIPELDIKAMYIRMGHHYAEEAAERRNRPFVRPSDIEAEAIGRKVRSMQQQEMTDINPERKPDSVDDYIWDTGKLILGGAADGSLASAQGVYTMTAAGLRKYRPDSENAQASARAAEALSQDLGQLRQAYGRTSPQRVFTYTRSLKEKLQNHQRPAQQVEPQPGFGATIKRVSDALKVKPTFSIASREQQARIAGSLENLHKSPDMRLTVYASAKNRFLKLVRENGSELQALAKDKANAHRLNRATLIQTIGELDAILSLLPAEVQARVGGFTTLANIGSGEKALENFFVDRVNMIERELEYALRYEYDEKLQRLFQRANPEKPITVEKHTGGPEQEIPALLNTIRAAMDWDAAKTDAHVQDLKAQIQSGNLTRDQEAQARVELSLVPQVANWHHSDATRRATAVESVQQVLNLAYNSKRLGEQGRRHGGGDTAFSRQLSIDTPKAISEQSALEIESAIKRLQVE